MVPPPSPDPIRSLPIPIPLSTIEVSVPTIGTAGGLRSTEALKGGASITTPWFWRILGFNLAPHLVKENTIQITPTTSQGIAKFCCHIFVGGKNTIYLITDPIGIYIIFTFIWMICVMVNASKYASPMDPKKMRNINNWQVRTTPTQLRSCARHLGSEKWPSEQLICSSRFAHTKYVYIYIAGIWES